MLRTDLAYDQYQSSAAGHVKIGSVLIMEKAGGFLMSEPARIATRGFFLWRVASILAPLVALLALVLPLMTLVVAAVVTLTLILGFPVCKAMLQQGESRRITTWWLGLSAGSILALLVKWALLMTPFPRYADYLPPEPVSPLRQVILDNFSALYWGVGWLAIITTFAAALVLGNVFQKLRSIQAQPAFQTSS